MCGIVGVATTHGRLRAATDAVVRRMRDRLRHRGPDGCGLYCEPHVAIGHRLLAIRDPGRIVQPFEVAAPDGDTALVVAYNGELYDTEALRRDLAGDGWHPQTACDTELVGRALALYGADALSRFRGMFAIAALDRRRHRLLLARDPFGMKPLFYAVVPAGDGFEIVFGSEPIALLDHPLVRIEPDWAVVSAYLTTIRTTLGDRTLFADIRTVRPGEVVQFDLRSDAPRPECRRWYREPAAGAGADAFESAASTVRSVVSGSVAVHLVSDRPLAALLSGGLDSTIVAACAGRLHPGLSTWVTGAGTIPAAGCRAEDDGDPAWAAIAADAIGTRHTAVPISAARFAEVWPWMVSELGVPLGTPNETAIYHVASALAPHATVVLSGEGADEFFAGYTTPQAAWAGFLDSAPPGVITRDRAAGALIDLVSWISRDEKAGVLRPDVALAGDSDAHLDAWAAGVFDDAGDPGRMETYLRVQRAFTLPGLLARLDSATMLASVEGRTPFADGAVAACAAALPAHMLFGAAESGPPVGAHQSMSGATTTALLEARVQSLVGKRVLREAFRHDVPGAILGRPKASFPIPFATWMAPLADAVDSGPAVEILTPQVRELVRTNHAHAWRFAWPVINLSLWLRTFWG